MLRLAFLALFSFLIAAPAFAQGMDTLAKQAYIIDYETGQVLFDKNSQEKMPTSSMSKTLTGYVVFDALRSGKITLEQEFPVSEKAWRMQGSKMFVPLGGMVKVEDLIRGMLIQSGNDATIVLAEGIAGTEEQFVEMMNKKAQEIGMKDSHFMNASGWPDPEHYSTAHDLALLGRALIHDFPDQYRYDSEIDYTYNNIKQGNRNPLLYAKIGADGIKTGHTDDGGYGLMGSAVRDGRRVIMVLNGMASMDERKQEFIRLMEWALASFKNVSILQPGITVANAPVVMGVEQSVPLIVEEDLKVTMPRGASNGIKAQAVFNGPLEAPVVKGQKVGVARIIIPNRQPVELPIVAAKDIPRLGFFPGMAEKLRRLVMGDAISIKPVETVQPTTTPEPAPAPATTSETPATAPVVETPPLPPAAATPNTQTPATVDIPE